MDKILISVSSFAECDIKPLALLEKAGFDIVRNPYGRRLNRNEVEELAKDCIGIVAGLETLDRDVLTKLPKLRVISRVGVGIDNIDLNTAKALKIAIRNTPEAPTQAVAEFTLGLILDLLRKISLMDKYLKAGEWKRMQGHLLDEKTVGIVGFGRIGRRLADLLAGFNVSIIAFDIEKKAHKNVTMVKMEELLKRSDIISLHAPGETRIIGKEEINKMKTGAYLINSSRGGAIDENALYEALKSGKIAGAALDVFAEEPYKGILRELENVILTPHAASNAEEARAKMELEAVSNLIETLTGERVTA